MDASESVEPLEPSDYSFTVDWAWTCAKSRLVTLNSSVLSFNSSVLFDLILLLDLLVLMLEEGFPNLTVE